MDGKETVEGQSQNMNTSGKRKAEDEISENKDQEESTSSEQEMEVASAAAGLYPCLDEFSQNKSDNVVRLLIIGKTGTGKSALGNMLLGLDNAQAASFAVGGGIGPKTKTSQVLSSMTSRSITVVDTPDMRNLEFTDEEKHKQVTQWKEWLLPKASAILLTTKKGSTYTPEEHEAYKEIKKIWGNDAEFSRLLTVVFTFGDNQEKTLDEELATASPQLKEVLRDASNRRYVFNSTADADCKRKNVDSFFQYLDQISVEEQNKDKNTMDFTDVPDEHRILIIGKTGNGKSSLGNTITGGKHFAVGRGIIPTTRKPETVSVDVEGKQLKVVDTPDLQNMGLKDEERKTQVHLWKSLLTPSPDAILVAVRCDIRYTAEEHAIYQEIKKLWGDDTEFCKRLVVAFTFGDMQDEDLDEEVKTVCEELKSVLKDAGNRYVLFKNKADAETKKLEVKSLLATLESSSAGSCADASDPRAKKDDFMETKECTVPRSVLIIGKTGNGKSSLANIIAGTKEFPVGRGLTTTTRSPKDVVVKRQGREIRVVDTPDISSMKSSEKMQQIALWKKTTSPGPAVILLAVRCDIRYTAEEYAIYQEIKKLWKDDQQFCQRLMVAFTFGDLQDEDLGEELKTVCKELKSVLTDAGNSYLQFSAKAPLEEKEKAVERLLSRMNNKIQATSLPEKASPQDKQGSTSLDEINKAYVCVPREEGVSSDVGLQRQREAGTEETCHVTFYNRYRCCIQ